jgi:hypothetical protein
VSTRPARSGIGPGVWSPKALSWPAYDSADGNSSRLRPIVAETEPKKHHALARRLLDRRHDYLRFTTDWAIPLDNNGSERDIRMIKLRQKVSGCLRSLTGLGYRIEHLVIRKFGSFYWRDPRNPSTRAVTGYNAHRHLVGPKPQPHRPTRPLSRRLGRRHLQDRRHLTCGLTRAHSLEHRMEDPDR